VAFTFDSNLKLYVYTFARDISKPISMDFYMCIQNREWGRGGEEAACTGRFLNRSTTRVSSEEHLQGMENGVISYIKKSHRSQQMRSLPKKEYGLGLSFCHEDLPSTSCMFG
jgi:hypothetical protein